MDVEKRRSAVWLMSEVNLNIDELHSIVSQLYVANIEECYGEDAVKITEEITEAISSIYSNVDYRRFKEIVVLKSLNENQVIDAALAKQTNLSDFAHIDSDYLLIEVLNDNSYLVGIEIPSNLAEYTQSSIIYHREDGKDFFYAGTSKNELSPLGNLDTYFVTPTFKSLDDALSRYKTEQAANSSCITLEEKLWEDDNRVVLVASPEHIMRDSLHQFLRSSLRGNKEVLREQNVSVTRPIDIRVTWNNSNHVALIEIKWIGVSASGTSYTGQSAITRANNGAQQLKDYLELFKTQSPQKNARGYLVVFDSRRENISKDSREIDRSNGLHYSALEIDYDPEFEHLRTDFEPPIRFFLTPKCT